MSIKKAKATSPGRRGLVEINHEHLYKGGPYRPLVAKQSNAGGRNSNGRISVQHRGGGHKQRYRIVDFKRDKDNIRARIERIEYDPNRSAHLALLLYADGERRYTIAPRNLRAGDEVISGLRAPIKPGNTLPLRNIPVGTTVHCIELRPGKGAQIARSAGSAAQLLAREGTYSTLKLRSGEMRKVLSRCRATVGEVSNQQHVLEKDGKAGRKRWQGVRPTVRGVAMNPIDHPHGGGEGRTAGGRHPVTPWGKPSKGYKTRTNKRTDRMIVRSRSKGKKSGR